MYIGRHFNETKIYYDEYSDFDSEGGEGEKYTFTLAQDGSATLNRIYKYANYNYTASSETNHDTQYFGTYTIVREDEASREIIVKLSMSNQKCKCSCGYRDPGNHNYEAKEVNEEVTIFENLKDNVVTQISSIITFFKP